MVINHETINNTTADGGLRFHPQYVFWGVLLLCTSLCGYVVEQQDFRLLLLLIVPAFLSYFAICHRANENGHLLRYYLLLAVLMRLVLLPAFPLLSDDLYRFIWDGKLWLAGINPFDHTPLWYAQQQAYPEGVDIALFIQMNSQEYYTVYPPVAQLIFVLGAWLSPESWLGSAVVIRVVLVLADLGSVWLILQLLQYLDLPLQRVLWYALNPLLVLELVGNLHFEGLMVFFVALAWYWLVKERWKLAAVAMALAVSVKLLPLLLLPFFIRRLGWGRSVYFFIRMGAATLLMWLPLYSSVFVAGFSESISLYFQRFYFNGSLYYILRGIGYWVTGKNMILYITPWLSAAVFLGIVMKAFLEPRLFQWNERFAAAGLFAFSLYLACATTVHPWYLTMPVFFALFTPWRWPLLWSAAVVLSYHAYSQPNFKEVYALIALEYALVVLFAVWEYRKLQPRSSHEAR